MSSIKEVLDAVNRVILGKEHQIKLALTCLLAKGHLLIEDLPGMGKTSLSHALSSVLGLSYRRVQFTSDLLPADILGVSIYDKDKSAFTFHKGPIFSQVVLADEINRASPKTQSALLEAMEEKQVSVEGEPHKLPYPFFVIATQNPMHHAGTYPLPESQLDRFLMRICLGFPNPEAEKQMLVEDDGSEIVELQPLISDETLRNLQQQVDGIHCSEKALEYILRLVGESRVPGEYPRPLSPRASKSILRASKAWALVEGRDHVLPDDIQQIFGPVTEHRLRNSSANIMSDIHSNKILSSVNAAY